MTPQRGGGGGGGWVCGSGVVLMPPAPTHSPPFNFVGAGHAQPRAVITWPPVHVVVDGTVSAAGLVETVWQASSAAAALVSPATLAQLENCSADASFGSLTTITKSCGPKGSPGLASKSSLTGPTDVQVNGICVGCVPQGNGGVIETICADESP